MRVFLGLFLPPPIALHVTTHLKSNHSIKDIRWIPSESLHITLKFIGDVDSTQAEAVSSVMEQVAKKSQPIQLQLSSGGVFPSKSDPRIFWTGLKGQEDRVSQLASSLENQLENLGIPRENRRYSPHVTLGRSENSHLSTAARQFATLFESYTSPAFTVNEISFVKSVLNSGGAKYETIGQAVLGS